MVKAYYSYEYNKSIGAGSSQLMPLYEEFIFNNLKVTYNVAEEIVNLILLSTGEIVH